MLDKLPMTSSMEVAEAGYQGLMAGQREIIPGSFNKIGSALLPFFPKSIALDVDFANAAKTPLMLIRA